MQELSRRTHARLLTDIAFAAVLAATASFGIAAAQAQTTALPQQDDASRKVPDQLKSPDSKDRDSGPKKEPATTGETRAAPAPRLPADQLRPPISGRPLDEPDKALHSAPPEKIEGK